MFSLCREIKCVDFRWVSIFAANQACWPFFPSNKCTVEIWLRPTKWWGLKVLLDNNFGWQNIAMLDFIMIEIFSELMVLLFVLRIDDVGSGWRQYDTRICSGLMVSETMWWYLALLISVDSISEWVLYILSPRGYIRATSGDIGVLFELWWYAISSD